VAAETLTQFGAMDVEHHDHEQPQHHDRAHVHQYQGDGEKLSLQNQPQAGAGEERQHQEQHCLHRIADADHHAGRKHQDCGQQIKNEFLSTHDGLGRRCGGDQR
jgi:hypothetical protein